MVKGYFMDEFGIRYQIPEKDRIIIGRNSDCDIVLPPKISKDRSRNLNEIISDKFDLDEAYKKYRSVSRIHAYIISENSKLILKDYSSTLGTFVNDVKLSPFSDGIEMTDNLRLRFGNLSLVYHKNQTEQESN